MRSLAERANRPATSPENRSNGQHLRDRDCYLLAALSGILLFLPFPLYSLAPVAWIALVPLFITVMRVRSWRTALLSGWLCGSIFFAGSCPWVEYTVRRYGGLPGPVAAVVFVLFIALMGSYVALFAVVGQWLARRSRYGLWLLPPLWIACEWLRTVTPFGGFPWNLLAYSQIDSAPLMLLSPVVGVYGLGVLIGVVNAIAAAIFLLLSWRTGGQLERTRAVWLGWAILAVVLITELPHKQPSAPAPFEAVLVQPNTSIDQTFTVDSLQQFIATIARASVPNRWESDAVRLILWPEQPAPLTYSTDANLRAALKQLAVAQHAAVLVDETDFMRNADGTPDQSRPLNSALLVRPDGTTGERYDKLHLVPFGEYVPLPDWLITHLGVGKLTQQVGDFHAGDRPAIFHLGPYRFAALICYESIFPALVRREVLDGAQWLVNLSDDGWYGHSSAAWQSLVMARMRAIESHRWLLRDTNDGVTSIIDPEGRVVAELPRQRSAVLVGHFGADTRITFYTRYGDLALYACVIILIIGATAASIRSRSV